MDDNTKAGILEDYYNTDIPVEMIAEKWFIGVATLYHLLKGKPKRNKKITPAEINRVRELRDQGYNNSHIATVMGTTRQRIARIVNTYIKGAE